MTGRLLVDLGADGMVRVTVLNGELPSYAAPAELSWPLDGDALEDLRWYLEDYLTADRMCRRRCSTTSPVTATMISPAVSRVTLTAVGALFNVRG